MHILIEEYHYERHLVINLIGKGHVTYQLVRDNMISAKSVGYIYNPELNDFVFILPKVLLKKDKDGNELVYGNYPPEDIINIEDRDVRNNFGFIYRFALYIYEAIKVYREHKGNSNILCKSDSVQAGMGIRRKRNLYLEIILALIRFNNDNDEFFLYTIRNLHKGADKINWTKTISSTTAIVQDDVPVYTELVNKRKFINFDEELLVIFYSIINYINNQYPWLKSKISFGYELITGSCFDKYLSGYGRRRLKEIRYKYFSDKALQLWQLCYAFFDINYSIRYNDGFEEYLLVKDSEMMFQDMVDELIGDKFPLDGMNKQQDDNRIIDHLFVAKSLIRDADTYYIGDSKYYRMDQKLPKADVFKQYTYARNVIRHNVHHHSDPEMRVRLRDEFTEGYDIVPNFFISGIINSGQDFDDSEIIYKEGPANFPDVAHYATRLFDRDTLLLFHYEVNYLFILSVYTGNKEKDKLKWKRYAHKQFEINCKNWLKDNFNLYELTAKPGKAAEDFITAHFKSLVGKIYKTGPENYVMALPKDDKTDITSGNLASVFTVGKKHL